MSIMATSSRKALLSLETLGTLLLKSRLAYYLRVIRRAMQHNEEDYPNADAFLPDRWIKDGQIDPNVKDPIVAFGFGRSAISENS